MYCQYLVDVDDVIVDVAQVVAVAVVVEPLVGAAGVAVAVPVVVAAPSWSCSDHAVCLMEAIEPSLCLHCLAQHAVPLAVWRPMSDAEMQRTMC